VYNLLEMMIRTVYVGSTWAAVEESETVVREEKKGKVYGMSAMALKHAHAGNNCYYKYFISGPSSEIRKTSFILI
jgi:hypothetical protein